MHTVLLMILFDDFFGLQIVFHRYFHGNSVTDGGTLWQLRCLIHRHNISKDVSKQMNELEDFFKLVGKAHIMAAALHFFGMDDTNEEPKQHAWPPELVPASSAELSWEYLHDILGTFVDQYIMPSIAFDITGKPQKGSEKNGIRNYACSLMTDCLVIAEFNDAVHEGDGERMMVIWKLLLLYFRASGHKNYALESVNLVAQSLALLSERDAFRLKWCRFVNKRGQKGTNIPCDLAMEHWNKAFKTHLSATGANIRSSTIMRTGMALSTLESITSGFDVASNVTPVTVRHSTKSADKDQRTMLEVLHRKHHVFSSEGSHSKFPNFKRNHLSHIDRKKFDKWIQGHIQKLSKLQKKQLKISQQNLQESITPADTGALSLISELEEEWDIDV